MPEYFQTDFFSSLIPEAAAPECAAPEIVVAESEVADHSDSGQLGSDEILSEKCIIDTEQFDPHPEPSETVPTGTDLADSDPTMLEECLTDADFPVAAAALSEAWLTDAEIHTILDMLMAMVDATELAVLDCLTPTQKQQVWAATPDPLKIQLQQLKAGLTDVGRSPHYFTIQIGDRVVLKARPGLSKAELIAIFDVVDVQGTLVHCKAQGVGSRRYPVEWLVVFRSPEF